MSENTGQLVLRGQTIKEDVSGYVCLNDLHDLAAAPDTKAPSKWRSLPTTKELEKALEQNSRFSAIIAQSPTKSAAYSKRGKGGGTFAHYILSIAYAEYLRAEFAIEVKDTYARLRTGDLEFLGEVQKRADAARHHNEVRDLSKEVRKKYTDALASHDATSAIAYCTDAIYQVLLGGSAKQIIQTRNLPANANVRDMLPTGELLQTMNTEYLSAERIEGLNVRGKEPCADASRQVAHYVKKVFAEVREDKPLGDGSK